MKYPIPSSFIVAMMVMTHSIPYISGSPVPGDAGADASDQGPRCKVSPEPDDANRYLYTGKGRPSPNDLKVSKLYLPWPRDSSVYPGIFKNATGVPVDLSSFAIMRCLVELDIQNIEKLLPYDDKKGDKGCTVNILGHRIEEIPGYPSLSYDWAPPDGVWPVVIQSEVLNRLATDNQTWDNMATLLDDDGKHEVRLTHDIDGLVGNSTRRVAELLWNEGLNRTGKAVTSKVPLDAQGGPDFSKVDDIISIIRNASAPALMATKKNLVGSLESDTIYTLSKRESGGLTGRNARAQPGDPRYEREIQSSEIINNAKFLTYFE